MNCHFEGVNEIDVVGGGVNDFDTVCRGVKQIDTVLSHTPVKQKPCLSYIYIYVVQGVRGNGAGDGRAHSGRLLYALSG